MFLDLDTSAQAVNGHNLLQPLPQAFILVSHTVLTTKKKKIYRKDILLSWGSLKEIQIYRNHVNRSKLHAFEK